MCFRWPHVGATRARAEIPRLSLMRVLHAKIAISLVILSSLTAGSGINYIHAGPNLAREKILTGNQSDTEVRSGEINDARQPREQRRANGNDTIREKKTLAALLLMLRDGRSAR